MSETPAEDEIPTDEQMHEWFPKLFARIDAELEELESEPRERPWEYVLGPEEVEG